jgi:hypothetical protein
LKIVAGHSGKGGLPFIDFAESPPNNPRMARPESVRRVKSYSSATGTVYNYYFFETRASRRGFHAGTDYVYMVGADRGNAFPLGVFVRRDAVEKWGQRAGRPLTGTEEYAVAKMRLFQAFDEIEGLAAGPRELIVDESNLDALLGQLSIETE